MNQCEMVVEYIKEHGSISSMEAFRDLGITRLSARIWELRSSGYMIDGTSEKYTAKNGRIVNYTRYRISK